MKKRIKYTNEPMRVGPPIEDFLPPPEEMRHWSRRPTVTLDVEESTIEAFRKIAGDTPGGYPSIMGKVLNLYASDSEVQDVVEEVLLIRLLRKARRVNDPSARKQEAARPPAKSGARRTKTS
jgi:hypothetical protein